MCFGNIFLRQYEAKNLRIACYLRVFQQSSVQKDKGQKCISYFFKRYLVPELSSYRLLLAFHRRFSLNHLLLLVAHDNATNSICVTMSHILDIYCKATSYN